MVYPSAVFSTARDRKLGKTWEQGQKYFSPSSLRSGKCVTPLVPKTSVVMASTSHLHLLRWLNRGKG